MTGTPYGYGPQPPGPGGYPPPAGYPEGQYPGYSQPGYQAPPGYGPPGAYGQPPFGQPPFGPPMYGPPPRPPRKPKERKPLSPKLKKRLIAGAAVVVVIALAAGGIAFWRNYTAEREAKRITDFANGLQVLAVIPVGKRPHGVVYDPGTGLVYTVSGATGTGYDDSEKTISVVDVNAQSVVATIPVGGDLGAVGIDPGAGSLFVTHATGANSTEIAVIDLKTRSVVGSIATSGRWDDFVVDAVNHQLWVVPRSGNTLSVVDTNTRQPLFTVPTSGDASFDGIGVDGERHRAYYSYSTGSGSYNTAFTVLDSTSGEEIADFPIDCRGLSAMIFDGAGNPIGLSGSNMCVVDVAGRSGNDFYLPRDLFYQAYDPEYGLMFATNPYANVVTIVQPAQQRSLRTIDTTDPLGVVVDTAQHRIYVANNKSSTLTIIGTPGS
ncbi:MAG: YncE family protein [Mycolicibacterium sp.]|nr:YncE family protein [Mycolicibacterium sp.]